MNKNLIPYYFYILGTVLFTVYGQLILKWRIVQFGQLPTGFRDKLIFLLKAVVDPFIFSGLVAAFIASLFWMAAVTRLDLSAAYPLITAGLTTITFLLAIVVLKEPLSFSKVLGLILIVSGVLVLIKDSA